VLILLSPHISASVVPIEDWIRTVFILFKTWEDLQRELPHEEYDDEEHEDLEEEDNDEEEDEYLEWNKQKAKQLHSTIHSICMACTSSSHVQSLMDEGILDYWTTCQLRGSKSRRAAVGVAMSHLASINQQCRVMILDSILLERCYYPLLEILESVSDPNESVEVA
jgi:hypothetical protein